MDLLGSILNKMDKPPAISEQQKQTLKKQREDYQKRQEEEKIKLKNFKIKIETEINNFNQDGSLEKITLQPMNKVQRSVVHEIAEIAGMSAFSFGEEDVDRHVVVYKKEFVPCPDELNALRKGQAWNPESSKTDSNSDQEAKAPPSKKRDHSPPPQYLNKYERLIGKETAKDAAIEVTQVNRKYGFVSSENKKDQRSIEQTLNDIRAKKKLKKTEDE